MSNGVDRSLCDALIDAIDDSMAFGDVYCIKCRVARGSSHERAKMGRWREECRTVKPGDKSQAIECIA